MRAVLETAHQARVSINNSRHRGRLICFIGSDGAGKTTLAKHACEILRSRGIRVQYVYARYLPALILPLMKVSRRLFVQTDPSRDYKQYALEKVTATSRHRLLSSLYQSMMWIDYVVQLHRLVTRHRREGTTVICDRYVHDTVVSDVVSDFSIDLESATRLISVMEKVTGVPDLTVYVRVSPQVSLQRKDDIIAPEYVEERARLYDELATALGPSRISTVDGNDSIESVKNQLELVLEGAH